LQVPVSSRDTSLSAGYGEVVVEKLNPVVPESLPVVTDALTAGLAVAVVVVSVGVVDKVYDVKAVAGCDCW
jgi:hypothetical protein